MFNASNKGLRCQICTGCGRCGVTAGDGQKDIGIRVLTQESLIETARAKEKGIPLPEDKRLAAADIGTTTIAMQLYRADGSVGL